MFLKLIQYTADLVWVGGVWLTGLVFRYRLFQRTFFLVGFLSHSCGSYVERRVQSPNHTACGAGFRRSLGTQAPDNLPVPSGEGLSADAVLFREGGWCSCVTGTYLTCYVKVKQLGHCHGWWEKGLATALPKAPWLSPAIKGSSLRWSSHAHSPAW